MKLPDFNSDKALNSLRSGMQAPLRPWISVASTWSAFDPTEWEILTTVGIDIDVGEVDIAPDGTFAYKGRKVLVYIRDQYFRDPEAIPPYKVHVAQCKTLDTMRRSGRLHSRYVVTVRTDGKFVVNLIPQGPAKRLGERKREQVLVDMTVCKNCLRRTGYKGYPNNSDAIFNNFNFAVFLKEYDSGVTELPLHTDESMPINEYSENQKALSDLIRHNRNYRCTQCGNDFTQAKEFLDLHHIDGARNNNNLNNLKVLCVVCHSEQPHHQHMKAGPRHYRCQDFLRKQGRRRARP